MQEKKTMIPILAALSIAALIMACANPAETTTPAEPTSSAYVATYDSNGASIGTVPADQALASGAVALAPTALFRQETGVAWYRFSGWNSSADGKGVAYAVGATLPQGASIRLYAQWCELSDFDKGPAGGRIFYVAPSYQKDAVNGDWRYMEAGAADLPRPGSMPVAYGMTFSGDEVNSNSVSTSAGLGSGLANTKAILAAIEATTNSNSQNCAARACSASTEGGFKDWYLPSTDELKMMNLNLALWNQTGIDKTEHWTSVTTGGDLYKAESVLFKYISEVSVAYQYRFFRVRAARRF